MASSAPSAPLPSRRPLAAAEWKRKSDEVKVSKTDLNNIVMDYLIIEGYQAAAEKFAQEANMAPQINFASINERVQISGDIYKGDIQAAIERINELSPELLDTDPALHFSLLRLQLIELIRNCTSSPDGDITPALVFATTQLAPRAPKNDEFLKDLERTMALLCFPKDALAPPLAELMDPALRRQIGNKVNQAILEIQGAQRVAKLRELVRLRAWVGAEIAMKKETKDFPRLDLDLDLKGNSGDQEMA